MTAYKKAITFELITRDDKVILFNCATGLKYPLPKVLNQLDKDKDINYEQFI